MSAASPFVFNVADLLRAHGNTRTEQFEVSVDWGLELSHTDPELPLVADVRFTSTAGGIVVRGTVMAPVRHQCFRCLEERSETLEIELTELFSDGSFEVEPDDYVIERDLIDLEQMLRDVVILAVPLSPSCGENCSGLGAATQSDLNAGRSEATRESPFAVLKELLDPGDPHRDEVADGGT